MNCLTFQFQTKKNSVRASLQTQYSLHFSLNMTYTRINYVNNYIEYDHLTKINGKSDYPALKELKDEVKENLSGIDSEWWRYWNGHICLGFTNPDYARVALVNCIQPAHPRALTIPPTTTRGCEDSHDIYCGGTIFVDHVWAKIDVCHQVSLGASDTVRNKELYEKRTGGFGIEVKSYRGDNGVLKSRPFNDDVQKHY